MMNAKYSTLLVGSFLTVVCTYQAGAASTPLALRYETNGVYTHGAVTSQTLEGSFLRQTLLRPGI